LLGRFVFVVGAANSAYQYKQGNVSGEKAATDVGMSAVGTFGGGYGFAANLVYTVIDLTIGWKESPPESAWKGKNLRFHPGPGGRR
jgi:hypothetical protein